MSNSTYDKYEKYNNKKAGYKKEKEDNRKKREKEYDRRRKEKHQSGF